MTPALPGAGAGWGRARSGRPIQWGVAAVAALLVLAPLLPIVWQALLSRPLYDAGAQATLGNFGRLLQDGAFLRAALNSVLFAGLATGVAQAVGGAMAVLVARTDLPGRRVIGGLVVWPLFLSQLVIGFGWLIIYGPAGYVSLLVAGWAGGVPWNLYTIPGMAAVAGVCQAPVAYLTCAGAAAALDPALEDAARASGAGPGRVLWRIVLPMLRPALTVSAVLNFVGCMETLSIPLVFGTPAKIELFTTFIYQRGIAASTPDYGLVSAAAVVLVALVAVLMRAQGWLLRAPLRYVAVGGKASRPRLTRLGAWRWPVFALVCAGLALFVLLPVAGVALYAVTEFLSPLVPISEVLTLEHFRAIGANPLYLRAFGNSIAIALAGGMLGTGLAMLLAVVVHRSAFAVPRLLEGLVMLPRAVPGMIAGIGAFYAAVLFPPLGALRGTVALLTVVFVMRYLPLGFGTVAPAMLQVDPALERSARVSGAHWWLVVRRIDLPLLRPAGVACFSVLFIHMLKDYSTAIFLSAPGSEVLGTTMLQLFVGGDTGVAAALAVLQIGATVVFLAVASRVRRG